MLKKTRARGRGKFINAILIVKLSAEPALRTRRGEIKTSREVERKKEKKRERGNKRKKRIRSPFVWLMHQRHYTRRWHIKGTAAHEF